MAFPWDESYGDPDYGSRREHMEEMEQRRRGAKSDDVFETGSYMQGWHLADAMGGPGDPDTAEEGDFSHRSSWLGGVNSIRRGGLGW